MRRLRELENALLRAESAVAVVLVLLMLVLAAYNVVYRNVLVPLQQHWAHSGPPVEAAPAPAPSAPEVEVVTPSPEAEAKAEPAGGDDFGGFGGGLEPSEAEPSEAEPAGGDDFGGFGGGLGDEAKPEEAEPEEAEPEEAEPAAPSKAGGDDFGGFGGGFGEEAEAEPEAGKPEAKTAEPPKEKGAGGDDFGGFGGGFGDEAKEAAPEAKEPEAPSKASDDFGGFGGGFDDEAKDAEPEAKSAGGGDFGGFGGGLGDEGGTGDGDEAKAGAEGFGGGLGAADTGAAGTGAADDEDGEDDFFGEDDLGDDDQFANLPEIDAVGQQDGAAAEGPVGGPPPEGSFAAWGVEFIDDIKLDWIDVFLRQLVIIVAFLGAMLATVRRKHINIDALSKVLPKKAQRVVAVIIPAFAVFICVMLARAGWDLVQISREFPKELLPFADEWHMQLMFPVGFGLMAVHFGVRLVESIVSPPAAEEAPDPRPSAIVTLVDEEYDPDPEILGSVRKKIAQIEMSGVLAMPAKDEADEDEAADAKAGEGEGEAVEAADEGEADEVDADEEGGR